MMRLAPAAVLALSIFATGCGGGAPPAPAVSPQAGPTGGATPAGPSLPPNHPPISGGAAPMVGAGAPAIVPPPAGSGVGESGLTWTAPEGWVAVEPSSPMRKAQYRVAGDGGEAELVVFYFGPGEGGDAQSNAERWASQFAPAAGTEPGEHLKMSELDVEGIAVTMVEVRGTYSGGMVMGGGAPTPQPGFMLLGAIAKGPDANWFFKLTGPEATVDGQRDTFDAFVRSFHVGAP